MVRMKKGAGLAALGVSVALVASACGGGSDSPAAGSSSAAGGGAAPAKGGTLYYLGLGPQEHWDPQRTYVGVDMQFMARTFQRTLTTYTTGDKPEVVPDLATDTGQVSDGGKTWKFTLRDGVKWEDGQEIKCEDVKYGISRTFAQDVLPGGPTYILNYLDVPSAADGSSQYKGPYAKTGQDLYDKAVTCEGKTVTFKFKKPWTDFNVATAAMMAFAPFRQDKDQGAKSDLAIFSSGPYKLEGTFDRDKGGKFVRNTNWDAATDTIRKAYPDQIDFSLGVQTETVYQRLLADSGNDKAAVGQVQAPPSLLPQIAANPAGAKRALITAAPYIDYIQPNVKSKVMSNEKARQALAMATNREAYVTALGGAQAAKSTFAMCNPTLACFKDFNPFGVPATGDPDAAKKVLQESGLTLPVPIKVVYRSRPTYDKALSALKESWDKAGFQVTLEPLTSKYYATIQSPGYVDRDVFWAGWGADWPSGSTVLAPLFDGRVNISEGGSGSDYGYFNDAEVNAKIDAAYSITDAAAREKAWGDIDEMISKKGGVVPLIAQQFVFMGGSSVKNLKVNPLLGGYLDMADIAVK